MLAVLAIESLYIFDISDPSNPRSVAVVDTPGNIVAADIFESYAYAADGVQGLQIIFLGPYQ